MAVSALKNLILSYALLFRTEAYECLLQFGGLCNAVKDVINVFTNNCPAEKWGYPNAWNHNSLGDYLCAEEGGKCRAGSAGGTMYYHGGPGMEHNAYRRPLGANEELDCTTENFCDPVEGQKKYCHMVNKDGKRRLGDQGHSPSHSLKKCEGDCDGDHHCEGLLQCFHRGYNGVTRFPATCTGVPTNEWYDYCYDPNELIPLTDWGNPSTSPHCNCLNACEGDCDGDGDCVDGLKCYHRTNDGTGNTPPGCTGSAHYTSHDYCYDAAKWGNQDAVPLVPEDEDKPTGFWTAEYVFNAKDVVIVAVAAINVIVIIVMVIVCCRKPSARIKYEPVDVGSDTESLKR